MKLYTINTGNFKLDGGAMFGVVPKSIWNRLSPADENNLCTWAMRCMLVEDGNRLILIDNGIGNKQSERFFSHYYLHGSDTLDKSLAAHGLHRNDITDVFLTHLHFDHCGGSIEREGDLLVPAFKNAVYWSNAQHWDWAVHPNEREKASFLKENILPIQESGQLKFVDVAEEASISEHFSVIFMNGHTNNMMLPKISYNGHTIVFMADLLPSVAHIPLPYIMAYDMFPYTTLQEKKQFLDEAAACNWTLFFEHDAHNECCNLISTEKGVRAGETFKLSDL
ncbi:MAG: MBL fold metallo-hydrolase [Dinghuibacter sp.]|nr:MBL fold metallo-hydrolase [Dinghuibacter sp.]